MNTSPLRWALLGLAILSAGWFVSGPRHRSTGESIRFDTHPDSTDGHQTARRIENSLCTAWPAAAPTSGVMALEIPVTGGVAECLIGDAPLAWYEVVIGSLGPGDRVAAVRLEWETLTSSNAAEMFRGNGEERVESSETGTRWRHLEPPSADSVPGRMTTAPVGENVEEISTPRREGDPGDERSFHFPVWMVATGGGGEWRGKWITARLMATHARVRVYVDRQDVGHRVSSQVAETVAVRLADVALPIVESWLGPITDADADGGLSVLVTSEVDQLPQGSDPLRAFVRSADLEAGPHGHSRGADGPVDIIYLNANRLSEGSLDGILTHEATHLSVFSRRREAGLPLRAEEWIDEGLAHAVEWLGTGDSGNLEARWAAFGAAPQEAALEVTCRAGSTAWRQANSRGATARFFTHVARRHGVATLSRIAIAGNSGRSAVAQGTGTDFDTLFRDWTVWEATTGQGRDTHLRNRARGRQDWLLTGTAAVRFPLGALPTGKSCRLRLEGPDAAALQLTVVRHGSPSSADSESSRLGDAAASMGLRR